MTAPVCLISGVGPGTGSALARRFAEGGYRVALLARNEERLAALEKQLPGAKAYRCDVSDPVQVETVAAGGEVGEKVQKIVEGLEANDDVQNVYTNAEFADEAAAK